MVLKGLSVLVLITLLISCGSQEAGTVKEGISVAVDGEQLFNKNCASCHGCNGSLGMSGAKDLSESTMTFNEMKFVIEKGKGTMPRFKEMLCKEGEMDAVVEHVLTLKKK